MLLNSPTTPATSPVKKELTHFFDIMTQCQKMTVDFWQNIDAYPPACTLSPLSNYDSQLKKLPEKGIGSMQTMAWLEKECLPYFSGKLGPRFLAYVAAGITPAALVGHWLATATGQSPLPNGATTIPATMTNQTIAWLLDMFSLPKESMQGTLVASTSIGNILAMVNACEWYGEKIGLSASREGLGALPPAQVFSSSPHISLIKALGVTGIGRNALVRVKNISHREVMDLTALEHSLKHSNSPFKIVSASCGTVTTGDFDDICAIANLCNKYDAWLHVDAAFGIFASLVSKKRDLLRGLERVDSIAADGHKWLNIPFDCGFYFTKHMSLLERANYANSSYLSFDDEETSESNRGLQLSQAFRALPIFTTLQAYGKAGVASWVANNCVCAEKLATWISQSQQYRLITPVYLNIVFFQYQRADNKEVERDNEIVLQQINNSKKVFLSPGEMHGIKGIRAAFCNWRTEKSDVEIIINVLSTCSP